MDTHRDGGPFAPGQNDSVGGPTVCAFISKAACSSLPCSISEFCSPMGISASSIHPCIHTSIICLSIRPPIHPSMCPFIHPAFHLSILHLSIYLSIHLSPFTHLSIHPSIHLFRNHLLRTYNKVRGEEKHEMTKQCSMCLNRE